MTKSELIICGYAFVAMGALSEWVHVYLPMVIAYGLASICVVAFIHRTIKQSWVESKRHDNL